MLYQVRGHAGHQLMVDTAKYYKVNVTGVVTKCLSCSLEKIRQRNIPKKNEDTTKNPGERMYLDISSLRHESLGVEEDIGQCLWMKQQGVNTASS